MVMVSGTVAAFTVKVLLLLTPLEVAVIVVLAALTPVASPLALMVAAAVLEETHVD